MKEKSVISGLSSLVLVIDSTQREETTVGLVIHGKLFCSVTEPVRAQDLQYLLEKLLRTANKNLSDIKAIAAVQNSESFTGTRIGVTTANVLAWSLDIPLIKLRAVNFAQAINEITKNNFVAQKILKPLQ